MKSGSYFCDYLYTCILSHIIFLINFIRTYIHYDFPTYCMYYVCTNIATYNTGSLIVIVSNYHHSSLCSLALEGISHERLSLYKMCSPKAICGISVILLNHKS